MAVFRSLSILATILAYLVCPSGGTQTPSYPPDVKEQVETNLAILDQTSDHRVIQTYSCNGKLDEYDCKDLIQISKKHYKRVIGNTCYLGTEDLYKKTVYFMGSTGELKIKCDFLSYPLEIQRQLATDDILKELGITTPVEFTWKHGTVWAIVVPGEEWQVAGDDSWDHGFAWQRAQRMQISNNICDLEKICKENKEPTVCNKVLDDAKTYYLHTYGSRGVRTECKAETWTFPCNSQCPSGEVTWTTLALTNEMMKAVKTAIQEGRDYNYILKMTNARQNLSKWLQSWNGDKGDLE